MLYSTIFRIFNSIITIDLMPGIGLGMLGILVGLFVANKIVDRLDGGLVKKLIYVIIGLCGLSNVITTLL